MSDVGANSHNGSYPATFDATCGALVGHGMAITFADPATGMILATSSMSLASWGENLQVHLAVIDPATTSVTVASSLKFGLVDWGKNRKNIQRVHDAIAEALASGSGLAPGAPMAPALPPAPPAPAGGWHPDPAGRHELRWWDGHRWTESVSDAGSPGSDPL